MSDVSMVIAVVLLVAFVVVFAYFVFGYFSMRMQVVELLDEAGKYRPLMTNALAEARKSADDLVTAKWKLYDLAREVCALEDEAEETEKVVAALSSRNETLERSRSNKINTILGLRSRLEKSQERVAQLKTQVTRNKNALQEAHAFVDDAAIAIARATQLAELLAEAKEEVSRQAAEISFLNAVS